MTQLMVDCRAITEHVPFQVLLVFNTTRIVWITQELPQGIV